MANSVKTQIESLVEQIFQNRREQEQHSLNEQLAVIVGDHNKRGMLQSGAFIAAVGRAYGQFFLRILDQTLERLELDYRQAKRQDGTYFWNIVDAKLKMLVDTIKVGLNNSAVDFVAGKVGRMDNASSLAAGAYSQYGDQAWSYVHSRVNELRLRAQFITLKSAADRKANDIPDVAVMMWFPPDGHELFERAKSKFQAIAEAVQEASNGLATVDKIDNPALIHKDRISPSVETWLAKSVVVICDLEGNRPNVFYEFGFARATGTDVLAVRPDGEKTDFHLAQWNIDSYKDFLELKSKLIPRLGKLLSNYDLSGTV